MNDILDSLFSVTDLLSHYCFRSREKRAVVARRTREIRKAGREREILPPPEEEQEATQGGVQAVTLMRSDTL